MSDDGLTTSDWAAILMRCSAVPSRQEMFDDDDELITTLAEGVVAATERESRRLALRCMCTLALDPSSATYFLNSISSVLVLVDHAPQWRDDVDSGLLLCFLVSLLSYIDGAMRHVSPQATTSLSDWLEAMDSLGGGGSMSGGMGSSPAASLGVDISVFAHCPAAPAAPSLLDTEGLYCLSMAASSGSGLAGLLLCVLMRHLLVPSGAVPGAGASPATVAVLQSLVLNSDTPVPIKVRARSLLLSLLASSQCCREDLLDVWVGQCAVLMHLPALDSGHDKRDPLFTPPGGLHALDRKNARAHAGARAAGMPRDVQLRARPDTLQQQQQQQRRHGDAEEEKLGHSWSCNSSILWARCPGLREVIEQLWRDVDAEGLSSSQAGAGALELEVDASASSLASLVRFVHGGQFVPPVALMDHLELFKSASDLHIPELARLASKALLARHDLSPAAIARCGQALLVCSDFAMQHNLSVLRQACAGLVKGRTGGRTDTLALDGAAAERLSDDAQLRAQVFQSLQDVEVITAEASMARQTLKKPPTHSKDQNHHQRDITPVPAEASASHTPGRGRVPMPVPASVAQPAISTTAVAVTSVAFDAGCSEHGGGYDGGSVDQCSLSGASGSPGLSGLSGLPEAQEYVAGDRSSLLLDSGGGGGGAGGCPSRLGNKAGRTTGAGGGGKKAVAKKNKSGGIYSLLLKGQGGGMGPGVGHGAVGSPEGSFVEDGWAHNAAVDAVGGLAMSPSAQDDHESVPVPESPASVGSSVGSSETLDWVVAAGAERGVRVSRGEGIFEFQGDLSLLPTPKKTEKELYLQEMSRPVSRGLPSGGGVDMGSRMTVGDGVAHAPLSARKAPQRRVSRTPSKAKQQADAVPAFPAAQEYTPGASLEAPTADLRARAAAVTLAAVNPEVGDTMRISASVKLTSAVVPSDPSVPKVPKSSLKLLKAKAKRNTWTAVSTPPPTMRLPPSPPAAEPADAAAVAVAEGRDGAVGPAGGVSRKSSIPQRAEQRKQQPPSSTSIPSTPVPKWKQESDAFREAMRAGATPSKTPSK